MIKSCTFALFLETRNKSVVEMRRRAGVYVCISAGWPALIMQNCLHIFHIFSVAIWSKDEFATVLLQAGLRIFGCV